MDLIGKGHCDEIYHQRLSLIYFIITVEREKETNGKGVEHFLFPFVKIFETLVVVLAPSLRACSILAFREPEFNPRIYLFATRIARSVKYQAREQLRVALSKIAPASSTTEWRTNLGYVT